MRRGFASGASRGGRPCAGGWGEVGCTSGVVPLSVGEARGATLIVSLVGLRACARLRDARGWARGWMWVCGGGHWRVLAVAWRGERCRRTFGSRGVGSPIQSVCPLGSSAASALRIARPRAMPLSASRRSSEPAWRGVGRAWVGCGELLLRAPWLPRDGRVQSAAPRLRSHWKALFASLPPPRARAATAVRSPPPAPRAPSSAAMGTDGGSPPERAPAPKGVAAGGRPTLGALLPGRACRAWRSDAAEGCLGGAAGDLEHRPPCQRTPSVQTLLPTLDMSVQPEIGGRTSAFVVRPSSSG